MPSLASRSSALSKARQYISIASSVRYCPARVSARVSDDLGVVGVDPHGPAEGVEPFLGPAELEAELGEELVVLGIARRGGQQVAAGLEGGVDPAQPGLQLGDARSGTRSGCGGRSRPAGAGRRRRRPGCRPTRGPGPPGSRPGSTAGRPAIARSAARTASGSLPSASR